MLGITRSSITASGTTQYTMREGRKEQMYCKLITECDCAVNVVLSCTPVEFLIINKAIRFCSTSKDFAESDRKTMVLMGKAMMSFEQVEVADTPHTDCSWGQTE